MNRFLSLIQAYEVGPQLLKTALEGWTEDQVKARPSASNASAGKWSVLEVVSHLADFEPVFLDRMMRVVAFDQPQYFSADENVYAEKLAYPGRILAEQLNLIVAVRQHWGRVLRTLPESAFARTGVHSDAGIQSLEQILSKVKDHLLHHLAFVEQKQKVLMA